MEPRLLENMQNDVPQTQAVNFGIWWANRHTHPRCWQWRAPTQGQCFLGPPFWESHDKRSIKWLGALRQRSRSTGLAKQTGKSRTKHWKETSLRGYFTKKDYIGSDALRGDLPLWKAQQRSALQSLWYWQVVPASPLVAFWLHWPQTHSRLLQHSSSLVQDWGRQKKKKNLQLPDCSFSFHLANGHCQLLRCTHMKFS